uniref:BPI fold containing family B member 1 n=1 Tax=Mustela putorius furo TaxID=9669 RepID=M3Z2B8_MUSPF
MAGPFTVTLLCGLLTATLAGATLNPPAVLSLGREIIRERLTQELNDHDAIAILQQLPLLSTIREKPAGGIPVLGNVVNSILKHIIWLKVTSANILQLHVEPSDEGQGLTVKIPLDMVAGLNTPLVKTIVEIHMETEAQAIIHMNTSERNPPRKCQSPFQWKYRRTRLESHSRVKGLISPLSKTGVCSRGPPVLESDVQKELCPVIKAAFEDMQADLLQLVRAPVSLGSDRLQFDFLSPAIKGNVIQLELGAKLLDSNGDVTKQFNKSAVSLTVPYLDSTPFSLTVRQDVVNAAIAALLPPEELVVLLDYVLPELARRLKSTIQVISEQAANQLGPTQLVKILTQETPELLLEEGSAKVAQLIVLEVFATNEAHRPFFTLGIEASSEAQFYTKGDRLMFNFNEISSDRIHLMNSGIGLFNPELLRNSTTEILVSVLLPNENGKLRSGIPILIMKAWGFEEASTFLTKDSLVITPASS